MSNITWNGRELTSFVKNNKTASYSYNADGIRTSYTYNGETVDYILDGTTILGEVHTDSDNNKEYIYYYYDENGEVTGLNYLGNDYYYIKNLQGDVMYITDDTGGIVVTYLYDAWGNILQILDDSWDYVGDVNPFTYRSYYYDFETGLYYLQSRYYDPQTGRFLNADDTSYLGASGTTLGFNLYAYCENNPGNFSDPSGKLFNYKTKLSILAGISYGLYKLQKYYGVRINSWAVLAQMGYTFANGFVVGFCTVYSLFSISKVLIKPLVMGVLNVVAEFSLGQIKKAGDMFEAFVDGYGGELSPSLLRSSKLSFMKDTIVYLCKLFTIKVY